MPEIDGWINASEASSFLSSSNVDNQPFCSFQNNQSQNKDQASPNQTMPQHQNISLKEKYKQTRTRRTPKRQSLKLFECYLCNVIFKQKARLKQHLQFHASKVCKKCNAQFKTKDDLYNHVSFQHGDTIYHCKECGERFLDAESWTSHKCAPSRPFTCVCGSSFSSKWGLTRHMITHDDKVIEKPSFQCNICLNSYASKTYLTKHIEQHHSTMSSPTSLNNE